MASLVMLTYAGVLLAFSVVVSPEMAAAEPGTVTGSRAIVVPIADPRTITVRSADEPGALILTGNASGSFPSGTTDPRIGHALLYIPAGANGTGEIDNVTIDLAAASGGAEGWIARGAGETEAWFAPADATVGEVARFEPRGRIGWLMAAGAVGFVAPLAALIVTHRGGAKRGADMTMCRECRAPLAGGSDFCVRCGAWRADEEVGSNA